MKTILLKKWWFVGVIWGVVLAMTGWNIHLINQVQYRRQELETLQMDLRFLQANQTEIQDAHRQRSRLIHPVKSFGLGFLVVENNLKRLSWDFGLQQMRVEADMNSQDTQSVPIKVFAIGPVPILVEWIAAVEDAHPYLVIERMNVSFDDKKHVGRFEATFNYNFTLFEPTRSG